MSNPSRRHCGFLQCKSAIAPVRLLWWRRLFLPIAQIHTQFVTKYMFHIPDTQFLQQVGISRQVVGMSYGNK